MGNSWRIQGPEGPKVLRSRWMRPSVVILIILASLKSVSSWQGDIWYFTSFQNVSEWKEMYPSCNINSSYTHMDIPDDKIPFTLSPIALPKSGDAIPVNRSDPNEARVLVFYNNAPPETNSYIVSYGFQKNKECISQSIFSPCLVSPTFGKIRAVTLTGVRTPLSTHKVDFSLEPPEQFVTIVNGGSTNERKFYEAIFLGNVKGSNGYRSTHTIDGKSYPMEIYMYFVDEVLEVMSSATILVVLVEEQEEDNAQIKPVINAVSYHLYNKERAYLKANHDIAQREQMYHHLKESTFRFKPTAEDPVLPNGADLPYHVPSSEFIERNETLIRELLEVFQTVKSYILFSKEDYDRTFESDNRFQEFVKKWIIDQTHFSLCSQSNLFPFRMCPTQLLLKSWCDYVKNEDPNTPPDTTQDWKDQEPGIPALATVPWDRVLPLMTKLRIDVNEALQLQNTNPNDLTEDMILRIREQYKKASKTINELIYESDILGNTLLAIFGVPPINHTENILAYYALFTICDPSRVIKTSREELKQKVQGQVTPFGFSTPWEKLLSQGSSANASGQAQGGEDYSVVEKADNELRDYYDYEKRFEDHNLKKKKFKRTGDIRYGENLGLSESEYRNFEDLSPLNESLKQRFQISWLIPKGGGYYFYEGSSPVPPCYQADRVIVFKKPIKMSREQIKTLTVVPSSSDKMRDIRSTLPPIHKLRRPNFPIYFDKRNHQFLRQDGFHKNSIFEAQRRREERAKGASQPTNNVSYKRVIIIISFLSLICAI